MRGESKALCHGFMSTFRFSGSAGVCSIQCIRPRLDLAYEYCGMYTRTVEPDRTRGPRASRAREIERESLYTYAAPAY